MINDTQREKLLKLYPVLKSIDEKLLNKVLTSAAAMDIPAGTAIFNELQPCNAFPFFLSGKIRVFKQSLNGRELSLYTVTAGDVCIVSTGCLLGDQTYNASGFVREKSSLIFIQDENFNELMSVKMFREFIFLLFSKRILELMQLVEEVAFYKLDQRLAAALLKRGLTLKISHQELADELGTVREMVSRVLKSFEDSGLIKLGRSQIKVLKESGLKEILQK